MKFIESIYLFFKNLFQKKEQIKMIEEGKETLRTNNRENFFNSLKIEKKLPQKGKIVETLVCVGDGLGIQNEIRY